MKKIKKKNYLCTFQRKFYINLETGQCIFKVNLMNTLGFLWPKNIM